MDLKNIGIAIISPSGYAQEETDFLNGIANLKEKGCRVFSYYNHQSRHERFGASDAARIEQFYAAATNPDIQIVMALRGGYGLSRLLPHLDYEVLAKSNKIFVGHSDFTVFSMALFATTGAVSFSGPMLCNDFTRKDLSDFTQQHFWSAITSPTHTINWLTKNNPVCTIEGTLWGGNLTMLTHMIGTPWLPQINGGILFIEDTHEHPYRIERMLLQLLHAGILEKQNALILGNFSDYEISSYDNGYDFQSMLARLKDYLKFPILTGLPFGHIRDKVTLPIGCHTRLISQGDSVQMELSGYPTI